MRPTPTLLCLLAAGAGACRARPPTYYRDVAPLIARHCRGCHRADGIAPVPPLDDYANVKTYAQPIRVAVQTRRMPPWAADETGLCGRWQDARWLTGEEIAVFTRWHDGGALAGDPGAAAAATPAFAAAPTASPAAWNASGAAPPFRADAALDTGGVYRPGLGAGGYRCFVADPALDRDRLLAAIRVVASDARGVAQVTLFALDTPAAEAQASALDAADPAPGYSCFGTARVPDTRVVASWTWPDPVLRLPAGTGVRLHGGRRVVVQIHYNIAQPGGAFAASTRVDLELDDGAREAFVWPVLAGGALAPGRRYVAVEAARTVERPLRLVGIAPRMHIRGETMRLTVEPAAGGGPGARPEAACLGNFDHWHFDNQQLFRAAAPTDLAPGDRVRISCAYGTLGRVQPVPFGDGIDDEECVAYLFVTER